MNIENSRTITFPNGIDPPGIPAGLGSADEREFLRQWQKLRDSRHTPVEVWTRLVNLIVDEAYANDAVSRTCREPPE
jgi:hypothetical protein